ncbi:MAG TPA: SRPBCC family protein, partial [Steroidobacteraceae bacterium]|nr:SRPBCC family protein [Steroidobacteraceae bacterium]
MAAEPKWQQDFSDHPDEWTDEDEIEWQEANASRFAPDERQLGQILGLLSVGLGLAQVLAPRALGRAIGVGDHPAIMRMVGVREIVTGLGILSERAPGAWAWARVAGDAIDLALLGAATSSPDADPRRIAAATAGVLGVTALDVYSGKRLGATESSEALAIAVTQTVTINSTPDELYHFWKNLENLPLFMEHLESVSEVNDRVSHWVAKAPAGTSVEWDAEIVDDQPDRSIGWRTLPDSQVTHEGMVSFEPASGGRGTIVRVEMLYVPPAGKVGVWIARMFGEEPALQVADDLRRLKQLLETGEVATTL